MIELKTLNKKALSEFISSGKYRSDAFLPITKHRAESQIRNPKADDDQTLLILAYEDEKLAGYVGCLPDFFLIDGKKFRYAWLSTLFVSSDFRGKRIAQKLLDKAFEEYSGNIAITEFTPEAESLYNKIKFFKYIQAKEGKRFYLKTDFQNIIPAKKTQLKTLKPFFKLSDFFFNSLISFKNSFQEKPDFKFEILSEIDDESKDFIIQFPSNRTADEINWFVKNPWILEGGKPDSEYLFSSYSKQFKYFWIKIFNAHNEFEASALLLLRDGHLKIPYLFANNNLQNFIDFLAYFSEKNRVKQITSYQTDLNSEIENNGNFPKIHSRNMERRYMFHEKMLSHLPLNFKPNFQDGDGDCALT
ncbi:GNAT family N-acetyltransferase [Chryseobacterium caseinilyticum]|uniref:GNAT family N-acetyltransferase n=1 Tax=Chryseobacterium caseinilyticum TaxID=2771428 RepID=A0ABR8ZB48_9FLAO|nr:GNAT family N-acetyltransferase [Chryseobacterium caseinilyticum]MBD8082535.1 GNAT family N-acetyltransferase [Chryseobacterium caseinilyticum]